LVEDFKNNRGMWTYQPRINGKQVFTVGGQYYNAMANRCKPGGYVQKNHHTYIGCTTTFKSCHDFIEWARNQIGYGSGQLDKDILLKGNKVYCPELCVFVPKAVNVLFTKHDAARGNWPIGVSWDKEKEKFQAGFRVKGKRKHLGRFSTPEAAFAAYKTAKEAGCNRLAVEYKPQIDPRVYQALLNYTVEIDD